jgi:hypothetical protein
VGMSVAAENRGILAGMRSAADPRFAAAPFPYETAPPNRIPNDRADGENFDDTVEPPRPPAETPPFVPPVSPPRPKPEPNPDPIPGPETQPPLREPKPDPPPPPLTEPIPA